MDIQVRALNLSPLGLFFVVFTSLPGYLLLAVATFLESTVFLSLLAALFVSHVADRLLTKIFRATRGSTAINMQRQAIEIMNQAMPGFGETVVNPNMRRLTAFLGVVSARWWSKNTVVITVACFTLGLYVAYVEQAQSVKGIFLGVITGCLAAAPFAYALF